MNGMRQGQNCPFTCAGEEMCKRKFRNGGNWLKTPESKSSRASGLNFERLANLGSSRVRPAKIGLNFEISPQLPLLFFRHNVWFVCGASHAASVQAYTSFFFQRYFFHLCFVTWEVGALSLLVKLPLLQRVSSFCLLLGELVPVVA
jgi:hypothetical protein